jgi:glycosyltransferase involved in cell wall biosynthesis
LILTSAIQKPNETAAIRLKEIINNISDDITIKIITQKEYEIVASKNIEVEEIKSSPSRTTGQGNFLLKRLSVQIFTLMKAMDVIPKYKPDIIYVRHGVNSPIAIFLSKLFNVRSVLEVHAIFHNEVGSYKLGKSRIILSLLKIFDRLSIKSSDGIIAVSPGLRKAMFELYKPIESDPILVPNGANTNVFKPLRMDLAREKVGLSNSKKVICFVGNLAPWQGLEYLVGSAPQVIKRIPDTVFLMVGEGQLKESLMRKVKELNLNNNFIFTGRVDYHDVPHYINASNVTVAPFAESQRYVYSGIKLFEYMACGKPVVTTSIYEYRGEMEIENAGLIVKSNDSSALANALTYLLMNKAVSEEMGQNGLNLVNRKYNWKNTAEKIGKYLKSMVNPNH